jgi:hypothetical protein
MTGVGGFFYGIAARFAIRRLWPPSSYPLGEHHGEPPPTRGRPDGHRRHADRRHRFFRPGGWGLVLRLGFRPLHPHPVIGGFLAATGLL